MKCIGCTLKEAEVWTDYLWLIVFLPPVVFTAQRTLVYINYGIKYYDQMEAIPIYQTCLLINNIVVGMLCLNELKFYSNAMLLGIVLSTLCSLTGIYILLQKKKAKMTISRTRFYKWLVSYAIYKEGVMPEEGRDQMGRWIIIRKKQNAEVQNQLNLD